MWGLDGSRREQTAENARSESRGLELLAASRKAAEEKARELGLGDAYFASPEQSAVIDAAIEAACAPILARHAAEDAAQADAYAQARVVRIIRAAYARGLSMSFDVGAATISLYADGVWEHATAAEIGTDNLQKLADAPIRGDVKSWAAKMLQQMATAETAAEPTTVADFEPAVAEVDAEALKAARKAAKAAEKAAKVAAKKAKNGG